MLNIKVWRVFGMYMCAGMCMDELLCAHTNVSTGQKWRSSIPYFLTQELSREPSACHSASLVTELVSGTPAFVFQR